MIHCDYLGSAFSGVADVDDDDDDDYFENARQKLSGCPVTANISQEMDSFDHRSLWCVVFQHRCVLATMDRG